MKHWKTFACLLLALVMCLSLAACGDDPDGKLDVGGTDWRTTGIWRGEGTITRGGEDTDVLVCVHTADAVFYYNSESQMVFGSVDYPIPLAGDAWEMFQSIDFADLNGDGNSDVTMRFDDGGSALLMVWFWDTGSEQYVYQPEESRLGEADDGRGDLVSEGGERVLRLMFDALPFANVEPQQAEDHQDGTYYYAYGAEDGLVKVVNMSLPNDLTVDQTVEEYLTDCALTLGGATADLLQTVAHNDAYSTKMTYPVYIVTYTAGGNEDAREWTVFAMGTDSCTYLFGLGTTLDAAEDMRPLYEDIFAGLYLSYGE